MIPFFSGKQILAGLAVPVGFITMIVGFFVSGWLVVGGLVAMVAGAFISYRLFNPVNQLNSALGELNEVVGSDEFKGLMRTMRETVDKSIKPGRRHPHTTCRYIDDDDNDNAA